MTGVLAYSCIDKMSPVAAKKELDECCMELSKLGIPFQEDWVIEGSRYKKEYFKDGLFVQIQGDVESTRPVSPGKDDKTIKCAVFTIDVDGTPSKALIQNPYNQPKGWGQF